MALDARVNGKVWNVLSSVILVLTIRFTPITVQAKSGNADQIRTGNKWRNFGSCSRILCRWHFWLFFDWVKDFEEFWCTWGRRRAAPLAWARKFLFQFPLATILRLRSVLDCRRVLSFIRCHRYWFERWQSRTSIRGRFETIRSRRTSNSFRSRGRFKHSRTRSRFCAFQMRIKFLFRRRGRVKLLRCRNNLHILRHRGRFEFFRTRTNSDHLFLYLSELAFFNRNEDLRKSFQSGIVFNVNIGLIWIFYQKNTQRNVRTYKNVKHFDLFIIYFQFRQ